MQAAYAQGPILADGFLDGQPITYQIIDGAAIFQGDIILAPGAPDAGKPLAARASSFYTGNLWPGGVIPYEIDAAIPAATLARVQTAIDTWNSYGTPIHLQPRAGETSYVRFTRKTTPPVGACSSSVGRSGAAQSILVEDSCGTSTLVHEIGHTVGFWHEQARIDRNFNVTVLYENVAKAYAGNFTIQSVSGQDIAGYEYGSSMHYGAFEFSGNGFPVLETVPPGIPMGETSGMNAADLDAVSRKYGRVPTQTTVSSNPPGLTLLVDGAAISTPRVFAWEAGSQHTLSTPSNPQILSGRQYTHGKWSDGGSQSHTIQASAEVTVYTENFIRKVQVVVTTNAGGTATASPASTDSYYPALTQVRLTATPAAGFRFYRWTSSPGFFCITTSANPLTVPPRSSSSGCAASFTQSAITTIDSDPPGQVVVVDNGSFAAPINFIFAAGSVHSISAGSPAAQLGTRLLFPGWSDGGAAAHNFTAQQNGGVITARFTRQYLLTVNQPSSSVASLVVNPSSSDGFYDAGTAVTVQANLAGLFSLNYWTGDLGGRTNPGTLVMSNERQVGGIYTTVLPAVAILNSLSFATGAIAPGEIVSIFGTNLGPPGGAGAILDSAGRVATEVGATRVLFDGVAGPIMYASPEQVNVVVPYALAGKTVTSVAAEYKGVRKTAVVQAVAATAPGIVGNGSGRAVVVNEDGSFNARDRPARRGSVIVFFATGEGVTAPAGVDGRVGVLPLAKPTQEVSVRIGGRVAEVLFAGNAPNFVAGAMQVNVRIPEDVPAGEVSLYLVAGTASSPAGTMITVE
ncbi:MAG: M12 family metallopeptidase [Acidobacteriota bacterium]